MPHDSNSGQASVKAILVGLAIVTVAGLASTLAVASGHRDATRDLAFNLDGAFNMSLRADEDEAFAVMVEVKTSTKGTCDETKGGWKEASFTRKQVAHFKLEKNKTEKILFVSMADLPRMEESYPYGISHDKATLEKLTTGARVWRVPANELTWPSNLPKTSSKINITRALVAKNEVDLKDKDSCLEAVKGLCGGSPWEHGGWTYDLNQVYDITKNKTHGPAVVRCMKLLAHLGFKVTPSITNGGLASFYVSVVPQGPDFLPLEEGHFLEVRTCVPIFQHKDTRLTESGWNFALVQCETGNKHLGATTRHLHVLMLPVEPNKGPGDLWLVCTGAQAEAIRDKGDGNLLPRVRFYNTFEPASTPRQAAITDKAAAGCNGKPPGKHGGGGQRKG